MVAKKWEEGRKRCGWLPDWKVEGRKRGKKEMWVVTRLGSRGSGSRGKKICWWLPDWEVEGVVAGEKRFVGGYPIRKSSRSDGSERCG